MGQCVSSSLDRKDPDSGQKYFQPSNLLLHDFPSYPPPKENSQTLKFAKFDQKIKASSFSNGSEKEAFYDTQPWLDSDCEDDFYSVNGDFTPSRGSTPVQVSFASPEIRRSPFWLKQNSALASLTPAPGQSPRKKSLSDLFEESGRYIPEKGMLGANTNEEFQYTSAVGSPSTFGAQPSYIDQKTPEGNATVRKVSSLNSVKCCLPQLLLSQSFSSRRKTGIAN